MANGTGSAIVAPIAPVTTTFNAPYSPSQIQQAINAQLAFAQAINPCGPISQAGLPGASAPPLWIVPPGASFTTVEGDVSTSTTTTEATPADGISINDLYNMQIPWWIFAVVILLFLLALDTRK